MNRECWFEWFINRDHHGFKENPWTNTARLTAGLLYWGSFVRKVKLCHYQRQQLFNWIKCRLSQSSFGSILSFRKLDFELTSSQRPNWPCINYSKKLHKGTEELYYTLWSELYETFLVWYFVEWCELNSSQWSLCPHHSVAKIHLDSLRYLHI